MSTTAEGFTDVACQCTDVSAFGTDHTDGQELFCTCQGTIQEFEFVDAQELGFEFHFLSFASQVVSALAIYLNSGESRRSLPNVTDELLELGFH